MNNAVLALVTEFANSRKCAVYERDRSRILLYAYQGWKNQQIAQEIGVHYNTVGTWRARLIKSIPLLNLVSETSPKQLRRLYRETLMDEYRCGAPPKYSEDVRSAIKLIACKNPEDYGYVISHWSLSFLLEAVKKNVDAPDIENICLTVNVNSLQLHLPD